MPTILNTRPEDISLNERHEILQFIGSPPSVLLRFGITAIACVVTILFSISYFVKYPDIVVARIVLTTENPPIRLLAKASGRVSDILVHNNRDIKKGQVLAVMDNTANWRDVLALEDQLNEGHSLKSYRNTFQLGYLQNFYSTYTQNKKDYEYFLEKNGVLQKQYYLLKQIETVKALNTNLLKQKEIALKEFELSELELNRQKRLHTEGVISDAEFDKFKMQTFQQKRQLEANETHFINNQIQIGQYEAQINDINQNKNDSKNTKELTLLEDVRRLKAAIEDWKQTYLIISPCSGTVSFSKIWSSQQNVSVGEEIVTIVPNNDSNSLTCKAILPISQSGKVKLGLTTNIKLDAFPYQQYGILKGNIANISSVPQKDEYLLDISVTKGLQTTYGKTLDFRQEMQGTANIVTEDRRILERILDRFRDLLYNN
jgi:multidrug resistance efflux pump